MEEVLTPKGHFEINWPLIDVNWRNIFNQGPFSALDLSSMQQQQILTKAKLFKKQPWLKMLAYKDQIDDIN